MQILHRYVFILFPVQYIPRGFLSLQYDFAIFFFTSLPPPPLPLFLSLSPFFPSTLSKVSGSARATLTHDLRSVDTCLLTYRNRGILSGIRMRDQIFEWIPFHANLHFKWGGRGEIFDTYCECWRVFYNDLYRFSFNVITVDISVFIIRVHYRSLRRVEESITEV